MVRRHREGEGRLTGLVDGAPGVHHSTLVRPRNVVGRELEILSEGNLLDKDPVPLLVNVEAERSRHVLGGSKGDGNIGPPAPNRGVIQHQDGAVVPVNIKPARGEVLEGVVDEQECGHLVASPGPGRVGEGRGDGPVAGDRDLPYSVPLIATRTEELARKSTGWSSRSVVRLIVTEVL